MNIIGAILAITATFIALVAVFKNLGFMGSKVREEEILGSTVNYIRILDERIKSLVLEGQLNEQVFNELSQQVSCRIGGQPSTCLEVSCQSLKERFQERLSLNCQDPLGRTWSLRKVGNTYYIHFSPFPEEAMKVMNLANTEENQKYLALKIASRIGNGGYVGDSPKANADEVYLPGVREPIKVGF